MEITINKEEVVDNKLECGDVVEVNGTFYFVINTNDGFVAKSFDGGSGATGYHETLELLYKSLLFHDFVCYSKKDYKLVLQKK